MKNAAFVHGLALAAAVRTFTTGSTLSALRTT